MKIIRSFKLITLSIILYLSFFSISFWNILEKDKDTRKIETIRDLKDNLNELNNKNDNLRLQVEQMIKEAWKLKDFFRDDLNEKELSDLKEIFSLYRIYTDRINKSFNENIKNLENTEEEKKNFLVEKAWVYKRLTKYIKIEKREDFLEFIKTDLETTKEKKDLEEWLYISNTALTEKVETIKEKIIEHKEALNEKLNKVIINKVDERIVGLKNNPKFKNLTNQEKKETLNKSIWIIEVKVDELKKKKTTINEKKLELYSIVKIKLLELYNSI